MTSTSDPAKRRKRRRYATVYDAVAGRVGYEGFLSDPRPSKYRDTTSTAAKAVPPGEILFRRKNAPPRYKENDIYFAARHLRHDQLLPDSDLLKTIHAYSSDFYAAVGARVDRGGIEFWSLDETALLALGILLEEVASEALGKTGYLEKLKSCVNERHGRPGC